MQLFQILTYSLFFLGFACSNSTETSAIQQDTNSMTQQKLQFTLTYSFNVRSRDSHGQTDYYVVKNKKIQKRSTFRGKIRGPEQKSNSSITPERVEQLTAVIEKLNLNQNYQKEYPVATSGVIRSYETHFTMGDYNIRITGGVEQTKDEISNNLKKLQRFLEDLIKNNNENFDKRYKRLMD